MIASFVPRPSTIPSEEDRIQELHQTVSAFRLNTWQSCRLKFYFRYVLKIKRAQPNHIPGTVRGEQLVLDKGQEPGRRNGRKNATSLTNIPGSCRRAQL